MAMLLCAALMIIPSATADSLNYDILRIEVNDLEAFQQGSTSSIPNLNVELLDTLNVQVTLQGLMAADAFVDDVVCEAKILGYEFGALSDQTPIFTVEENLVYSKVMNIPIPDDIDASEQYTLRIECSDPIDEEQMEFTLVINEIRHYVNIFDVITSPSNTVGAGQPVIATIRVENRGQKEEDNVRVTVSIPELGVSATNYIDELVTLQQEEQEEFLFEEEAQGQIDLLLRIPQDAPTGEYTLRVDVEYNRGHNIVSETRRIFVEGIKAEEKAETVLNIDATSKQVNRGDATTYTLTIANLGTEKGIYSVMVDGLTGDLQATVEPGFLTVLPDSTGQVRITVTPSADAEMRDYTFVANIMLGKELINQVTLHAKVAGEKEDTQAAATTFKTVLAVLFIILVVVLVALGLFIAFRKEKDETTETSMPSEAQAQTYYTYYPKN